MAALDDLFGIAMAVFLAGLVGIVLGVVGLVRANRALREIERIKGMILVRAAPVPVMAAPLIPEPVRGPPPLPALEPAEPAVVAAPRAGRDWEATLTAQWGVWLGAAALLLAGVFLVRYASDEGLLGPGVRCLAMVALAGGLVAGAEWLRRRPGRGAGIVDYAPAALAAGGVGILFGAAYLAGPLYGLVPALVGFGLMAGAAVAGMALSLRFGPLVAAVGIVGAFVTPSLVPSEGASVPGLVAYLLVVTAAALGVVRYSAWVWLGWATVAAGALWVVVIALGGPGSEAWASDGWTLGLFVPAAALLHLVLLPGAALDHPVGRRLVWVPVALLGAAGLLLAVVEPGFATRAGVLLLVPLTIGRGAAEARLDRLPWVAAGLFLLLILVWGVPAWQPTGEVIAADGLVLAILPGAWVPGVLVPLLQTAAGVAAMFAGAGLWLERRRPHALRWAALPAAVPVLALAVLYVRVKGFAPDGAWAGVALAVAAGLTGAAALAVREGGRQRAGVHAAGATAALALGCGMLLTGQWLTLAIALFLPALAWIEGAAGLPQVRPVALAVAGVALVRLLFNPYVLEYADGAWPVLNGLLVVYGVAAVAFAVAGWLFRRRADGLVVAVLELGAAAFATALVVLEVRHWASGGKMGGARAGFLELALDVSALAVLAVLTMRVAVRLGRPVLGWAWRVQGALALAGGVALIVGNPAVVGSTAVGAGLVANALVPAYLVPAVVAGGVLRWGSVSAGVRRVLGVYALVAGFVFVTLMVRHSFHPGGMALADAGVRDAELWAYSGAWLACGVGLMAGGIVVGSKALRLAALALVAVTGGKVFLFDMGGLVGLWRVLSFLGLGLTLIGLGAGYRRFVAGPAVESRLV